MRERKEREREHEGKRAEKEESERKERKKNFSPVKGQPLAELVPEDEGADREQRGAPAARRSRSSSRRGRHDGSSRWQDSRRLWSRLKRGRRRSSSSGCVIVFGGCRPIRSRHPEERGFPLHLSFAFESLEEVKS